MKKNTNTSVTKVANAHGYDYYIIKDEDGKSWYNIVPEGQPQPSGGYAKEWILGIKKVPDLF